MTKDELESLIHELNPYQRGNNFVIDCPECGHREAGISITKNLNPWGCYRKSACGAEGNIYTLKKYGIKIDENDKTTQFDSRLEKKELKVFEEVDNSVNLPLITMPLGYKRVYDSDYLNSRGFNKRDYEFWEVGKTTFGFLKDYIIFPITKEDSYKAYVARLTREQRNKFESKYRNSVSEFSSLVGGSDKITSNTHTVILCEGKFDIINITRLLELYDCEEIRSVCSFGAKVSSNQVKILKDLGITNVILLFDGDVISKIKSISFELTLNFNVQVALFEDQNIDAGDCNLVQLSSALSNAKSPLEFNLSKIEKKI
jgi:hypothetical protein